MMSRMHMPRCFTMLILLVLSELVPGHAAFGADTAWSIGWHDWEPYQMEQNVHGQQVVRGLDVEILRELSRRLEVKPDFVRLDWNRQQEGVRDGSVHVMSGVFETAARKEYARFSQAYRDEENAMLMRRSESSRFDFTTVAALRERMVTQSVRVGRIIAYVYADPELTALLNDPALQGQVVTYLNEREALKGLWGDEVDLVPADRLVAQTIAWREGFQSELEEHESFRAKAPIHFMLSKAVTSEEDLNQFNAALDAMRMEGSLKRIQREYLHPLLLSITISHPWYFSLELIGVVAFSISGYLLARRERYTLVAGLLFASLPAMGGGILRDFLLQRSPIGILRTPAYFMVVLITVATGVLLLRLLKNRIPGGERVAGNLILWGDALGLAAFTVTGVVVAVEMRADPLWLWGPVMAVVTATAGGIVRDTIRSDGRMAMLTQDFYAEIAVFWGTLLSLLLFLIDDSRLSLGLMQVLVIGTVLGGFLTRLAAIHWNWKPPRA
jgi:polar amino acid transport system substrate-binding protein